jgi:uncharacterized lipoprotein YddW (UPF0748 family)/sugar lactone lactonase YvrE
MKKIVLAVGLMVILSGMAKADEVRALWITRWDYTTTSDVDAIINNAADCNFNLLLFQVRGNATVFYQSSLEPWAWELTGSNPSTLGQDPGWNPLQYAITKAHEKGLELHAYMNTYPGWRGTIPPPPAVPQLWNTHHDWFCVNSSGTTQTLNSDYVTLSPGIPEVQDYLYNIYMEVVNNYDIDGFHYDYVRYPSSNYSWDAASLQRFYDEYGGTPESMPAEWSQWRRDQVTAVVRRIYDAVKSTRPQTVVSAATWNSYSSGYNSYFQDARGWVQEGILDTSHPMCYTSNLATFESWLNQHIPYSYDRFVCPGIGAHAIGDVDTFLQEVSMTRNMGAHGLTVFAYSNLFPGHTPNDKAAALINGPFKFKDRIPSRSWKTYSGDDDNTGPRIYNFSTDPETILAGQPFFIQCDITDPSDVYDDSTGSEGQGVFLKWNINARPQEGSEVKMSLLSGDTYQTDQALTISSLSDTLYYQVTAYDNDFDGGQADDRTSRTTAILELKAHEQLLYIFDFLFGPTLDLPQYCVVDQYGKLWICDYSGASIHVLNEDGGEAPFSPLTSGLDSLSQATAVDCPSGIAAHPDGTVYVTIDDAYDVPLYQGILKFNSSTGDALPGKELAFRPGDLDFDDNGNMFIVEKVNDRWHVFTQASDYATSYSFGPGTADHTNRGIAVTNDGTKALIACQADGKIHKWTGGVSGGVASFTQEADLTDVTGASGAVDVDNNGYIFVCDFDNNAVKVFDESENLVQTITRSTAPALQSPRGVGFTQNSSFIYIVQFAGSSAVQRWEKYQTTEVKEWTLY